MNRRGFLGALSAAPLLSRKAAEDAAAQLSGLKNTGLGHVDFRAPVGVQEPTREQYKRALLNPLTRDLVRGMILEQERQVYILDHDLAGYKSFSLAAKICYQRQRNVERRMKEISQDYVWERINNLIFKTLNLFGGSSS